MTSTKPFKIISTILTTIIFGAFAYYLYYVVITGALFLNNDESMLIETLLLVAPLIMTLIWGWIRHRKLWIGYLITICICTVINTVLGETVTPNHVPIYVITIVVPFFLCLYAILKEKDERDIPDTTATLENYGLNSSSGSSSSCDDCGAYGYPADRGPSYNPSGSIDVSDM